MSDIFAKMVAELDRMFGVEAVADTAPVTPDFYAEPCPQCHATGAHANGCELGPLP